MIRGLTRVYCPKKQTPSDKLWMKKLTLNILEKLGHYLEN